MSENELLAQYCDAVSQPPKEGHILRTMDGSPVVLFVQIESDKPPFIFGRAYLSEVINAALGWYVRGVDDDRMVGWKCVLMTRARRAVIKRCADQLATGRIMVKSLKVVRPSTSGRALLCEVHEFCDEEINDLIQLSSTVSSTSDNDGTLVPDENNGIDAGTESEGS